VRAAGLPAQTTPATANNRAISGLEQRKRGWVALANRAIDAGYYVCGRRVIEKILVALAFQLQFGLLVQALIVLPAQRLVGRLQLVQRVCKLLKRPA